MMGLAMLNAAKALGCTRAAVAGTYYNDEMRDGYEKFLEDGGVRVLGIENWVQQGTFPSQEDVNRNLFPPHSKYSLGMVYRAAVDIARKCPDADCVYILGGAIPALPVVEALEQDLGKPVLTNVGAQFWEVFHRLGIGAPINGYGCLLGSLERKLPPISTW